MTSSTSTSNCLILSTESSNDVFVSTDSTPVSRRATQNKNIVNAIYAYIRALRSLGRTTINTDEIAEGLSLNVNEVNRAVSALRSRGVRKIRA
jgi:hypothetical protein